MVTGIDGFRAQFTGHEHQYVLIGGAACELIMNEVGLDFRATKDLDIVLIIETLDDAFADRFWAYVEEGGYQIRERGEGEKILYRFQKPVAQDFSAMLELFSRSPEGLTFAEDSQLTPFSIDKPDLDCVEVDWIVSGHLQAIEDNYLEVDGLRDELSRLIGHCRDRQVSKCRIMGVLADHSQCLGNHDRN